MSDHHFAGGDAGLEAQSLQCVVDTTDGQHIVPIAATEQEAVGAVVVEHQVVTGAHVVGVVATSAESAIVAAIAGDQIVGVVVSVDAIRTLAASQHQSANPLGIPDFPASEADLFDPIDRQRGGQAV